MNLTVLQIERDAAVQTFLAKLRQAKSYSLPTGEGVWTVYRLVTEDDVRALLQVVDGQHGGGGSHV